MLHLRGASFGEAKPAEPSGALGDAALKPCGQHVDELVLTLRGGHLKHLLSPELAPPRVVLAAGHDRLLQAHAVSHFQVLLAEVFSIVPSTYLYVLVAVRASPRVPFSLATGVRSFALLSARELLLVDRHCLLLVCGECLSGEGPAVAATAGLGRAGGVGHAVAPSADRRSGSAPGVGRLRVRGLPPGSQGRSRAGGEELSLPRMLGAGLVEGRRTAGAPGVDGRGGDQSGAPSVGRL